MGFMGPTGLHHVTAITGDVQANVDFYVGLLGLRLIKRTVNHQDPATLHLFYGDAAGRPGSLLTFFAWPDTASGRRGIGQATEVGLVVPRPHIGFWYERLLARGVRFGGPSAKGGMTTLSFEDPDGLPIALVGVDPAPPPLGGVPGSDVPADAGVRGLHHVTFWSDQVDETAGVLTQVLGFHAAERTGTVLAFHAGAEVGNTLYVRDASGFWPAAGGVGTVHHVAFRRDMDEFPGLLRSYPNRHALGLSALREHGYFRSSYFREPSGALIEVASDGPGFGVDEPLSTLGETLALPPDLEVRRSELDALLPSFVMPGEPRPPKRELSFVHRFVPGASGHTLLLLHGEGGDETTLLPMARQAAPEAALLALRGHDFESGRPSCVRYLPDGTLDGSDLDLAAAELVASLADAASLYGFDAGRTTLVGHVGGAVLALAAARANPHAFGDLALLRPRQVPDSTHGGGRVLEGKRALLILGESDPALAEGQTVAADLGRAGAQVEVVRVPLGEMLWDVDTEALGSWLAVAG